jgi:hypothetical protein
VALQTDNGSLAIAGLRLPVGSTQEAAGLAGMTSYGLTLILSGTSARRRPCQPPAGWIGFLIEARPNTSTCVSVAPVLNVNDSWKLALEVGEIRIRHRNATTSQFSNWPPSTPSNDTDVAVGLLRTTDDAAVQTSTTTATWV